MSLQFIMLQNNQTNMFSLSTMFQLKYKRYLLFNQVVHDKELLLLIVEFLDFCDIVNLYALNTTLNALLHGHSRIELQLLRRKVQHYESKNKSEKKIIALFAHSPNYNSNKPMKMIKPKKKQNNKRKISFQYDFQFDKNWYTEEIRKSQANKTSRVKKNKVKNISSDGIKMKQKLKQIEELQFDRLVSKFDKKNPIQKAYERIKFFIFPYRSN